MRTSGSLGHSYGIFSILLVGVLAAGALTLPEPAAAAPRPACADAAPTEVAAESMARACDRRVEDVSARAESSSVFVNADGTRTMVVSATVQRVRRADGSFVAADPTLRRNVDGTWSAVASTADVRFSGGAGTRLVTFTKGPRSFTMDWLRALPVPTVTGDTATYADVLDGVDLVLRATVDGFTHVLVVKNAKAAANPALRRIGYRLGGSRVRFAAEADNGVVVTGDDGEVILRSGGAAMWDSSTVSRAATGARGATSGEVEASTARVAGDAARTSTVPVRVQDGQLVLEPDPAALTSAQFPLYIDPAWFPPSPSRWAYATNNNSNNDTSYARVGRNPESGVLYRSFFEFPTSSGGQSLAGSTIISANFAIVLYHSWSCGATPVYLWRSGGILTTPRTAWAPGFERHLDTQSAGANKDDCYTSATPTMTFGNLLRDDVQIAASGGWGAYTLSLAAYNPSSGGESTESRWKKFFPNTATLTINYNKAPPAPAATDMSIDPSYVCGPSALRINAMNGVTLRTTLSDPDGDNVKAQWQVNGVAAQYAPPDSPFAAAGSFTTTVPAAAFTDGGSYSWTARGDDGTVAGAYGPTCSFIVDNSVPGAPAAASTELALGTGLLVPAAAPTSVVGRSTAVNLTPAGGDQNIVGYLVGLGAGAAAEPVAWVGARADGTATAPVVPVVADSTINYLTVRARNAAGLVGGMVTYRFRATAAAAAPPVRGDATGDRRADVTTLADVGGGAGAVWRWNTRTDGTSAPAVAPQDVGTTYPTADVRSVSGDFDGDGLSDVALFRQQGTSGVTLSVQRSDGNSLTGTQVKSLDSTWHVGKMKVLAGDVDNDAAARDDIVVIFDHGNDSYSFRVFLSTGSPGTMSFADFATWYTNPVGYASWHNLKPVLDDLDGDQRADIGFFYQYANCQTKLWTHYSTGSTFGASAMAWDSGVGNWCWDRAGFVVGDFDADGAADVMATYRYDGCATAAWGFYGAPARTITPDGPAWSSGTTPWCAENVVPYAGDVNGDGRSDLALVNKCCGPYQNKLFVLESAGRTLAAPAFRAETALGPVSSGTVTFDPTRQYQIVAVNSDKCISMPASDGVQATQQNCANATTTFTVHRVGGEFVQLRSATTPGACLDLRDGSLSDTAWIHRWTCHDPASVYYANQLFRLTYISGTSDIVLRIVAYRSGKVFDIEGFSTADGGRLQQYTYNATSNQQFRLRVVP